MSKLLTVAAVGVALCAIEPLPAGTVHAASRGAARLPQSAAVSHDRVPDRALLDQYCVSCHNDRLKTGGLTLDNVDVADARGNAEVLEKVVRKLRTGQMPPMGRPRPDAAAIDTFADSMEAQLDRA